MIHCWFLRFENFSLFFLWLISCMPGNYLHQTSYIHSRFTKKLYPNLQQNRALITASINVKKPGSTEQILLDGRGMNRSTKGSLSMQGGLNDITLLKTVIKIIENFQNCVHSKIVFAWSRPYVCKYWVLFCMDSHQWANIGNRLCPELNILTP